MPADNQAEARPAERGWDEHELSQLRYFRSLSLREKLLAVEGMADLVRHSSGSERKAGSRQDHNRHMSPT